MMGWDGRKMSNHLKAVTVLSSSQNCARENYPAGLILNYIPNVYERWPTSWPSQCNISSVTDTQGLLRRNSVQYSVAY